MIIRHRFPLLAAGAALVLTACSGGGAAAEKPAHPVFDAPVQGQPRKALLATQKARSASFTQTLTFTSRHGGTVLTSKGRLDFPGTRASGSLAWKLPAGLPGSTKEALLGTALADRTSASTLQVAIDPSTVRIRPGTADYWLRYDDSDPWETSSIDGLRGSEAAFGGTLLEIVSGAGEVKWSAAADGGRRYRAQVSAFNALDMFAQDIRGELNSSISPNSTENRVALDLTTDSRGRITRAEADLTPLLREEDSALYPMNELRAVLTMNGYGASAAPAPAPSGRTLAAKEAVRPIADVPRGTCVDGSTGIRNPKGTMVVQVSCQQPHDARVFAHPGLGGTDHPGEEAAERQAHAACERAHDTAPSSWTRESVESGAYWLIWPTSSEWGVGQAPKATCYVMSR
ncbi:hypothetical protein ABZ208_09880 [Streptomyces sp. NPDC006208]|uniref:hypothetical protein n=1 Tax=Streptomyces sp. NPDC006208 TaxID=3156734 RepID=UPI0033B9878D